MLINKHESFCIQDELGRSKIVPIVDADVDLNPYWSYYLIYNTDHAMYKEVVFMFNLTHINTDYRSVSDLKHCSETKKGNFRSKYCDNEGTGSPIYGTIKAAYYYQLDQVFDSGES